MPSLPLFYATRLGTMKYIVEDGKLCSTFFPLNHPVQLKHSTLQKNFIGLVARLYLLGLFSRLYGIPLPIHVAGR